MYVLSKFYIPIMKMNFFIHGSVSADMGTNSVIRTKNQSKQLTFSILMIIMIENIIVTHANNHDSSKT